MPANGTVIPSDSSVHYEVVTDRRNGNSASITYDVVTRFGDKVGEVDLHLSVPGSRWNSETRSCEVRGAVVHRLWRRLLGLLGARAGGTPRRRRRDVATPVAKRSPTSPSASQLRRSQARK